MNFGFRILFVLLLFIPSLSSAKIIDLRPSGPLPVRTQNPLYLQFLSIPPEPAQTLNRNQFETSVQTTFSNIFEFDPAGLTQVNLDMELWRTAFSFSYGLTDTLDVKIELPVISNGGGFLDDFIQWYHNLFGLPNAGRDSVPNHEFHYTVAHNGVTLADYPAAGSGLSDMVARFKYLVSERFQWPFKLALAAAVKAPTGQSSKGLGSGRFDGGLTLLAQKSLKRFHLAGQVGYTKLGGHSNLQSILKSGFFHFGQSLEFQLWNWLSPVVQLTGNTPGFKNVDTEDLSVMILDLNIGAAGTIPLKHPLFDEFFYQASFGEDILSKGPSVDFSVFFLGGLRY